MSVHPPDADGSPTDAVPEPVLAPIDPNVPLPDVRDAVAAMRTCLETRFLQGESVTALVEARSRFVDQVLALAWHRFGLDDDERRALVAVGGYGRGELHPGSDIDLLILTRRAMRGDERERVNGFLAFLWDIGLAVGSSVRTVRECMNEARSDVTVATNLMDGRLVGGSAVLCVRMRERTGPPHIWSSRRFFEAKMAEQRARHHRFDDTGYNLEPNVKEGPGGLRDIQTIAWVTKRHFGAVTLAELVDRGFLTTEELDTLESGRRFLWRVRFALHVLTRRPEDRLLFDHQRRLAEMLGFEDDAERLGVERLMKRYYREVMELSRLNEMLLEHFEEAILHARHRDRIKPLNRRFQAVNGYLEVTRKDVFHRYPFALLEVFLLLQQHPDLEGVRASTIRLIRANRHRIDDRFRADLRARSLFLEILRQPRGINHELRRMHRYGILGAYLPVFGQVAGQMQYDLFHVYTVDEHSLFVVRNLRRFADPARHHEFPHCADIFARLPKPELIYVAGLFHDIAKGRNGDHSELGSDLVREFCARHGFGRYDTDLVAWLVQHHLLMSITAQRRDISDPEVVSEFARTVGDHVHLDYLYLLTIADIRGTNPGLWNDWKDALLHDLYRAAVRALLRGLENPIERADLVRET
ncbi:MAG: [protein-PII] uridylyltransferase, partial [Thiotrichales bacterium]|nr:[protein-PII] uridylyltransferase [Thiotrichales bacterium]